MNADELREKGLENTRWATDPANYPVLSDWKAAVDELLARIEELSSISVKGVPAGVDHGLYYDRWLAEKQRADDAEAKLEKKTEQLDAADSSAFHWKLTANELQAKLAAAEERVEKWEWVAKHAISKLGGHHKHDDWLPCCQAVLDAVLKQYLDRKQEP